MEELENKVNAVKNQEDFVLFVEALVIDLKNNPQEWENRSLESFLEALGRCTEDIDGYYKNMNIEFPKNIDWRVFANILITAKIYE